MPAQYPTSLSISKSYFVLPYILSASTNFPSDLNLLYCSSSSSSINFIPAANLSPPVTKCFAGYITTLSCSAIFCLVIGLIFMMRSTVSPKNSTLITSSE